jgi:hypothetical protein
MEQCINCKYCAKSKENPIVMICKRYPPNNFSNNKFYAEYTGINQNDWCGEWRRTNE